MTVATETIVTEQVYLHYEPYVGWWVIRERGAWRFMAGASHLVSDAEAQRLREAGVAIR